MASVTLKPGREKSVLRCHPWIFSGALQRADKDLASGTTVDVLSSKGEFLARGAFSPHSQIRVRVWTFEDEAIDNDFFHARIKSALHSRDTWHLTPGTNALRLIYAESDGIPGLIVDRYDDILVLQSLSAGCEYWKEIIAELLLDETGLKNIYERSDADVRELEGLSPQSGFIRSSNLESRISNLVITENGLKFIVDYEHGHKTGFYLDQRANRQHVRQLSKGEDVLDCFCYTGGFTVNALMGEAKSVLSVDASSDALMLAKQNVALNDLPVDRVACLEGDVFQMLRRFRDENRSFDMIILDPPKFAPTAAQAGKAARGYKDINLLAFKLLRPDGILVTFSCSGGVDPALFQKIVASAALDAGVESQIVGHLSQAADHPIALNIPESAYLKGLICLRK
jgi:23S rRNA (cytosine1962-C5)-methyltransferase